MTRHRPARPVPASQVMAELRGLHGAIREFYAGKPEDVLGHVSVYDPLFGWLMVILALRLGIHHDQLHYDDVLTLAQAMPGVK